MKELTIEQKAKRYDEAYKKVAIRFGSNVADEIFLKESEDERIRKALVEMVHDTTGDSLWVDYNVHKENALAWLEKRGQTFTKKDVDDAYLKGISDTKNELEKQGEQNLANSAKTCKDEQKPAWSEEDENGLSDALWCCKQAASIAKDENDMGNAWYAENWLKSLKDKYALVAEIEKLRKNAWESFQKGNSTENQYYLRYGVILDILSFINTLEVKEVDLEKEIELVKGDYEQVDVAWNNDFDYIARHFYELGMAVNNALKGK